MRPGKTGPFKSESKPRDDTDTGDRILSRGMGLTVLPIPLHKVVLECELVNGEVAVGVRPALPLDGIHFILGNGLAAAPRFDLPVMLQVDASQVGAGAVLLQGGDQGVSYHTLIQLRGSMLALALITLELETCCPDWLALTIDLLKKAQIDSSELIRSRELVARSLSTPKASLPPNTVYIYQPLQSPTTLQPPDQDPTLRCCTLGIRNSTTESSRDHAFVTAVPQEQITPGSSTDIPALLSPPKNLRHLNHLQKVTLRCKASSKRKVEEMEVDDFFDGIKRLYNEDITTTAVQEGATPAPGVLATGGGEGEGGLGVCSVLLSRQEGSCSPCPPLQPVSAS
ncbi:cyclin-I-like [Tautogolabrus adspersus]